MPDEQGGAPDHWQLIQEVIDAWNANSLTDAVTVRGGRSAADYPVLHAFSAHCHRQAQAVLYLRERGMLMEAIPLIRSTYELAITASWIAQVDDALAAFGQEGSRTRDITTRLIQQLDPTVQDHPNNIATTVAINAMETSAKGRAGHFRQMCDDLHGVGASGYLYYRVMCTLTHASINLADLYSEPPAEDEDHPSLRWVPRLVMQDAWGPFLFGALIWSGQALETRVVANSGRKKYLRTMAKMGRVAPEIRISDAAWLREQGARKEAKRQRRAQAAATRAKPQGTSMDDSSDPQRVGGRVQRS